MKKLAPVFTFLFLIIGSFNILAQESFPCKEANLELKELFLGRVLDHLYVHSCSGAGLHEMSSSYLEASGVAPKIIEDPEGMEPPSDTDYVNWTCKYSMGNIADNNPATAWVEGVEGYGIGEVLIVPCLDLKEPVKIWIGYGKSDKAFKLNSRPKLVRLVVIRAELPSASQYGTDYKNLCIVSQSLVKLEDLNGYQPLESPYYKPETYEKDGEQWEHTYFLGLEIAAVYEGSKYADTCISEIRNE